MSRSICIGLALLALTTPLSAQTPLKPMFDPALFAAPAPNPFFPLMPGVSQAYSGTRSEDGKEVVEHSVQTVLGPGPIILGVPTVAVLDDAFASGRIVERTFDYFAADQDGNIWYLGEDVTNFHYNAHGGLSGTDNTSAWRAGVNGAEPGILVPAQAVPGLSLFQEHAPADKAMDYAQVVAMGLSISGPAGQFDGVMQAFEGSTIDATLREYKYYAPGTGLIRADEDLSEKLDTPRIVIELQP